jgi:hypothetical protein
MRYARFPLFIVCPGLVCFEDCDRRRSTQKEKPARRGGPGNVIEKDGVDLAAVERLELDAVRTRRAALLEDRTAPGLRVFHREAGRHRIWSYDGMTPISRTGSAWRYG